MNYQVYQISMPSLVPLKRRIKTATRFVSQEILKIVWIHLKNRLHTDIQEWSGQIHSIRTAFVER